MQDLLAYVLGAVAVLTLVSLGYVGYKLRSSATRVNRSLDPILQKSKTLKIEISALKRSRLDRQRRLESTGTQVTPKK
jgi:hypothetical protein